MEKKKTYFFYSIIFLFILSLPFSAQARKNGIYHKVAKGETLSRISAAYQVPLSKLMKANRLSSPSAALTAGQKLFIPGARAAVKVPRYASLTPQEKKDLEASLETEEKILPSESSLKPGTGEPETPPWKGKEPDIIWPIQGKINSPFGPRNKRLHAGIDIASPSYQEVKAAMDGEVILAADSRTGYGKVVVLRHDLGYTTIYGHMNVIIAQEGEIVRQGQAIGGVGSTGKSTGPHLHFELRREGRPIDPMAVLPMTIEEFLEKAAKK